MKPPAYSNVGSNEVRIRKKRKSTCPSNSTTYLKLAASLPQELYLATAATGP